MNSAQGDGKSSAGSRAEWRVSIVAGTGEAGYAGDGGPATAALLNNPFDLAFFPDGSIGFSDTFNHCIRRIDAVTGVISTLCGSARKGDAGDGGPATQALLNEPYGIVIDRSGRVFFADRLNRRVRVIETDGTARTLTGTGRAEYGGDGGPAAAAGLVEPNGLALDEGQRNLFIADVAGHRVRVVDLQTGLIDTFAGTGEPKHEGDGGPASRSALFGARAVAFAPDGALYVMERQGSCIRAIRDGRIETVAGTGAHGYAGDGANARQAVFDRPKEMAIGPDGSIYVVDTENNAIRRIDGSTWVIETIATGLARPHGALVAPDGSVLVGDSEHHQIRRLTPPVNT